MVVCGWQCLPWIGPLFTLLRKWICVVDEVGYDDTGRFGPIDGIERIDELLVIVRITFDGSENFLRIVTVSTFGTPISPGIFPIDRNSKYHNKL